MTDHLPETRELVELCGFPCLHHEGRVILNHKITVFAPFTDWNDVHRVVGVVVERGLFDEWAYEVFGEDGPYPEHFASPGRWATAALEVLRAAKGEDQ